MTRKFPFSAALALALTACGPAARHLLLDRRSIPVRIDGNPTGPAQAVLNAERIDHAINPP